MTPKKPLQKLPPEVAAALPAIREEWLAVGLSTERADRALAEEGVRMAYQTAGLKAPRFYLWFDSPWAGLLAANIMTDTQVRSQVGDQVGDQVRDQVGDQVEDQVWDQVGAQVRDQVEAQVEAQVLAQVEAQVRDQVEAQVWDQVGDQVWAQVGDQVLAQVGDQVRAQVRAQVGDQVRDQAWDQVGDQVRDQVWDQVLAQVRAQVGDQVRDQAWDQVEAQVRDQVRAQVWAQVEDQVLAQVEDQVRAQVLAQVGAQVLAQVGDQVWAQVLAQVGDQVEDQVRDQVGAQVRGQESSPRRIEWLWPIYGQHEAGWLSYYDVLRRTSIAATIAPLDGLLQVARHAGWWWPFTDVVILTERPTALHRDAEGRLHHPDGPAIAYADGWSLYAVHGVRVPERVIQNAYTAADITAENNAEVRRVMLERYGEARYIEELGATPVDTSDWGTLYQVEQPEDEPLTMVAVWNSTAEPDGTFKRYWLPVHPECRPLLPNGELGNKQPLTALNAVASSFGLTGKDYATVKGYES